MIKSIQIFRGVAAMLVVAYHANMIVEKYLAKSDIADFFRFGHSGVPFFFVLSGFIIYYVHHHDIGTSGKMISYVKKRIIRIYPIYWLITLAVVPVYFIQPDFGDDYHRSIASLGMSLLLIPQSHSPHLAVAWTLCHEMLFYLLFAILVFRAAVGRFLLVLWMSGVALSTSLTLIAGIELSYPLSFLFSHYNLLFGFGLICGWLVVHRQQWLAEKRRILFVLGTVSFLATGIAENSTSGLSVVTVLFFGLASACVVLSCGDNTSEAFFSRRRLGLLIGNASYSIYLTHFLSASILGKIVSRLPIMGNLDATLVWILIVAISTAAGIAVYLVAEKPLVGYFRRLMLSQHTAVRKSQSGEQSQPGLVDL